VLASLDEATTSSTAGFDVVLGVCCLRGELVTFFEVVVGVFETVL